MIPVGNSSGLTCFMYECSKICFGFGVRPDILDPTIVKVSYPVFQTGFWYVSVFSLNTLTWSRLQDFQLSRPSLRLKRKSQAVIGRFIYWAGTEKLVSPKGVPYKDYTLVSFDMVTRQFHIIEITSLLKVVTPTPFTVCELGNSVVISGMIMTSEVTLFTGWVLDVDGTSITRFSNLFCIPTPMAQQFVSLGIEGNARSFYIAPHKESLLLINHSDRALYSIPGVLEGVESWSNH
ncbi:F-box domain-containing protein [Artemisia annua]|uniref:F-box domain-containing protein n=1 Tax=Artemisia annua TaxID=35608 RepID=A0A2U1PQ91_ARTAN|nr:F-box domain-containing protein [Artemisia annua]